MMLQCESFVACGTLVSFRPLVHVRMFLEMFLVKEYLVALSTFFMVNSFPELRKSRTPGLLTRPVVKSGLNRSKVVKTGQKWSMLNGAK
jgi:hypothetical protein